MSTMTEPKLDPIMADRIFDVLVEHAGVVDDERMVNRAMFVTTQARGCTEYRFGGYLGFGGKFWHNPVRARLGGEVGPFYVNCYPEDLNPNRRGVIDRTNAALKALSDDLKRGTE